MTTHVKAGYMSPPPPQVWSVWVYTMLLRDVLTLVEVNERLQLEVELLRNERDDWMARYAR